MPAPKVIVPPGYQPELDRLPARPAPGCMPLIKLILIVVGLLGAGLFVLINSLNSQRTQTVTITAPAEAVIIQTSTPIPTYTIDPWSATGTALVYQPPTATADYCWFLTPTAMPTPLMLYTPDAWAATGTAIWHEENPPTPYIQPSPTTPKSWCDYETATPTPTAIILLQSATPTPTATNTPRPTSRPPVSGGDGVVLPPTIPPIEPTLQPVILPTLAPPTAVPTKKKKTRTPTPTATSTATATLAPGLPVLFVDCAAGPVFIVQADGIFLEALTWEITWLGNGAIAASGQWMPDEIRPPGAGLASAPAWAGIGGIYRLSVDGRFILDVQCADALTATPSPTVTFAPEMTLEPVYTPTIEGQS